MEEGVESLFTLAIRTGGLRGWVIIKKFSSEVEASRLHGMGGVRPGFTVMATCALSDVVARRNTEGDNP